MLDRLHLKNFRCFKDHQVPFRPVTLIVGRNNAGKSTIVEALRLVSLIVSRRGKVNYRSAPEWTGLRPMDRGLAPSLHQMGFDFRTVFHHYSQPPAEITATFSSGDEIRIYIGPNEQIFATIRLASGSYAKSKGQANTTDIPSVIALPQIGPLSDEETILAEDYIRKNSATELASRHFRNQVRLYSEDFDGFKRLAEESWPRLQIKPVVSKNNLPGDLLGLRIRDGDFVGEVATMGHGLQMWLQTMWFLARSPTEGAVILESRVILRQLTCERPACSVMECQAPLDR